MNLMRYQFLLVMALCLPIPRAKAANSLAGPTDSGLDGPLVFQKLSSSERYASFLNTAMSQFRSQMLTIPGQDYICPALGGDLCFIRAKLFSNLIHEAAKKALVDVKALGYIQLKAPDSSHWGYHVASLIQADEGKVFIADTYYGGYWKSFDNWASAFGQLSADKDIVFRVNGFEDSPSRSMGSIYTSYDPFMHNSKNISIAIEMLKLAYNPKARYQVEEIYREALIFLDTRAMTVINVDLNDAFKNLIERDSLLSFQQVVTMLEDRYPEYIEALGAITCSL